MTSKILLLASISGIMFVAATQLASAENALDPAECSVSGIIQGGGGLSLPKASGVKDGTKWAMGFGEAAIDFVCSDLVGQLDGAYYGHWNGFITGGVPTPATLFSGEGHLGGAVFWRQQDIGMFGISGSRIFQTDGLTFNGVATAPDQTTGLWRIGAMGEYYGSDTFTLGGGIHYINGQNPNLILGQVDLTGVEGDVYAKFYAAENFDLSVRGDLLSTSYNVVGHPGRMTGYAISANAEYLVPSSALSFFLEARYASRTWDAGSFGTATYDDTQGLLGFKYAFGSVAPSSLRDRDRHGSYDNTSVFNEKLPNFGMDGINFTYTP